MKRMAWAAMLLAASILAASAACASEVPEDAVGRLTPDASPALGPGANWALRGPADGKLAFRGVVSFDHAGFGAGAMFYPGFGLAGFFAALATHGVLLKSAQNSEKAQLQKQADEVLAPYRDVLADFDLHQLAQAALERSRLPGQRQFIAAGEPAQRGLDWLIDIAPIFSMTQDQSALVLDNVVVVRNGGDAATAVYRNIVRVVSHPRSEADLPAYWNADHGAALKAESADLLAQSLALAMADMSSPGPPKSEEHRSAQHEDSPASSTAHAADAPQRTVRYLEGHVDRMERAQLIGESCGRRLLRTLRGWLMSVPAMPAGAASAPAEECADDASVSR